MKSNSHLDEFSIVLKDISKQFNVGYKKDENALYRILRSISGREQKKILQVLKSIAFQIKRGERVGIIGRNGSGKSTLLRLIAGIYEHNEGEIVLHGTVKYVSGFSQGLKAKLTMRENIFLIGSVMGLSRIEVENIFERIVDFTGLCDFVDTKVYQFSSGMITRLTFSIFIHCIQHINPDILLLDEVIGAGGDIDFTEKANERMKELVLGGATILFVSHRLSEIEKYCQRVIWIENGNIQMIGDAQEVIASYKESKKT